MSRYEITFADVLRAISNGPGHVAVLAHFAGDIFGDALRVHATRRTAHVDCPFPHKHGKSGGKLDFRLKPEFDRDGSAICSCGRYRIFDLLVECGRFSTRTAAMLAVADHLGLTSVSREEKERQNQEWAKRRAEWQARREAANTPEEMEKRARSLQKLWSAAVPISAEQAAPARAYFAKRGVPHVADATAIRFVPSCAYRDDDGKILYFPAIVSAVVTEAGKPISLHRIYITREGDKAPVQKNKRLMPALVDGGMPGCFIPVNTVKESAVLNVCEGVETARAVAKLTTDNTWSCVSAPMLKTVKVPRARFEVVRIWADKDEKGAGQDAARALANRLLQEGFAVELMLPKDPIPEGKKSLDWEDVYVAHFKGMRGYLEKAASAYAEQPIQLHEPFQS